MFGTILSVYMNELYDELFLTGDNELQQLTGQMRKMGPTVQR